MTRDLSFKKSDDELQVIYGELYAPSVPDSQGDFMSAEQIRLMAWSFLKRGKTGNVDRNHDNQTFGAYVAESFIARDGDPDFIPGSWVIGVHVPDPIQWTLIKKGTFNGFSMDGDGERSPSTLSLNVPDWLVGETSEDAGHSHTFTVRYGSRGEFLGGETDKIEGHEHSIIRGTVTEEEDGHTHRFSFVEQVDGTSYG